MYFVLLSVLAYLSTCHCLIEDGKVDENHCVRLKELLDSSSVSLEITKKGFHREVVTTVELSLDALSGVRVMLVHRWPRGVYLDPYQLASLSDHSDWQILLDSAIDLEVPAHKTSGFVTYVYPSPLRPTSRLLRVTLPIHGRYHEPTFDEKRFTSVNIEPPDLLCLNVNLCSFLGVEFNNFKPHTVLDAPCSPDNSSTCPWVRVHHQQKQGPVCLQFPVGDGSLVTPVCAGTLLVTMICCVALSKYMWEHRIV
uniref:Phosphatidylinositol-glycan biosynthesis class X protein n=1 Tax=Mola mola TaxID=94237 RepID=A0A3Q3VYP1_MOLML